MREPRYGVIQAITGVGGGRSPNTPSSLSFSFTPLYPFEPPSTPANWEPHPSILLVPGGGEGSSRPPAGSPSTVNSTPGKRPCVGVKYTQQQLWGAPPPR
ncbi:unnamed protein product [Closterium sp. Naga37s-1]|nr:unnamed protein product [Closterium sp. Naga37s-1]